MKKIVEGDPETRSADIVEDNVERLKELFPEAFTEGKIDFEVLKQLLGGAIEEREEKYGLNWHGKRRARQLALSPSTGTLRPCPEDSVDWDTTQNLMIEGDNLEVLKLLQKSYAGKVKMIYIDPPYNTGNDFVYPDKFRNSIENYFELTDQADGNGRPLSSNPESSGRFHTDWLNMVYPRLKLARWLLRPDGVVFMSIDDGELPSLRLAANEVFGEENFLACFIWKSRQNKDNRTITGASVDHEYVLSYGNSIRGAARNLSQYSNPDNDPRGDWASANMVGIATADRRPNLHYDLIDPNSGISYGCPEMGWRYDRKSMAKLILENRILWPEIAEGRPRRKAFFSELGSEFTGFSTIVGGGVYTRDGTAEIDELFGSRLFSFPKPTGLLTSLIEQASEDEEIVLDFFAGSGTTAHAVMKLNAADDTKRRYILVQLPEPLLAENRDQKTAADFLDKLGKPRNIAELTKERLRRAGQKISREAAKSAKEGEEKLFADFAASRETPLDLGFRVFKLDSSNIRAWDPDAERLEETLEEHATNLKEGRTEQDILFELLLKLGLDLCVPIETREIAREAAKGAKGEEGFASSRLRVHSIGGGALIACLAESVTRGDAEPLALGIAKWWEDLDPAVPVQFVFRDSGFADDVAKTNLTAILEQHIPSDRLAGIRSI